MNILQGEIAALITGTESLALPPQDFIYGLDLCDRWEDDRVISLLNWTYDRLADGGMAIFTNLQPDFPDRLLMKHILTWQQYYRRSEDWRELLARSRFGGEGISFKIEETGCLLFAIASKMLE